MPRRARALAFGLATVILSSSLPALGDEAVVTVVTKSGAKYRGELVEEVPNDHITIKLATGEVKRFAWGEVERGDSVGPIVALESSQAVILERFRGGRFEPVCRPPCNLRVAAGEYRLSGDNLRTTKPFVLGGAGTTKIEADLGGARAHTIGMVIGVGGLSIATWSVVLAATRDTSEGSDTQRALFVVAGASAVVSLVGFLVAAANSNTVKIDGRPVASRRAPPIVAFTSRGLVF